MAIRWIGLTVLTILVLVSASWAFPRDKGTVRGTGHAERHALAEGHRVRDGKSSAKHTRLHRKMRKVHRRAHQKELTPRQHRKVHKKLQRRHKAAHKKARAHHAGR